MKNSLDIPLLFKRLFEMLLLTLMLSTPALSSGIYKWTDESGNVHYGSQRPQDAQAERMELKVPEPASPAEELEEEENNEAELSEEDRAQRQRDIYCSNENSRLKSLQKNQQIHEMDASGKVKKLTAAERNERLSKLKSNISRYCK